MVDLLNEAVSRSNRRETFCCIDGVLADCGACVKTSRVKINGRRNEALGSLYTCKYPQTTCPVDTGVEQQTLE